ncbi:TonB-dependent receptor [uncultured Algimonas sp.]|uniref:TonB-dependent receptor domain-containing protein n=1 Tax=uncultured Algimonas sp. TaxID=1547920 RepID=UPI002609CC5D|nr:TonB-dependent receptor [uncultured Algimonas sp.]
MTLNLKSRRWSAGVAALALVGGLAAPTYAQVSRDAELDERSEEQLSAFDQEEDIITVYGTANPVTVFEYPGQVGVITREDIEIFAPSSISDALRDVPGVEFSGGPRRTGETPSIRGRGGENVLILLDGARQSFISVHDGRFFLDPDLVKSAEVVKGPASSLYGSGAVGGVLAFETIDASDFLADDETFGARVRLGYQSVNEDVLGTLTAYTQQGGLDLVGSVGLRTSGDIELGSGADLPSDDDIQNYFLKAGYAFSDAFSVEGSYQRFQNTAVEPNNGQGVAVGNDIEKDIGTDTVRFSGRFDPVSDLIDTTLTAYFTDTAVEEFDPSINRMTVRDIETTGLGLRNNSDLDLGGFETRLTFGGDWYRDEQVGTDNNSADNTRAGVPDGSAEFIGLFIQAEARIEFSDTLDLLVIPGIRYDSFDSDAVGEQDVSDTAWSPRLAASLGSRNVRVFGSYSEGFRAPSINELYLDGVHFPVPHPVLFNPARGGFVFVNNNFVPNPNLLPEKAKSYEGGLSLDFDNVVVPGDTFRAKGSYYTSDVTDLINIRVDFAFDPTCFAPPAFQPCTAGTTVSDNLANAELSGYELEAVYESGRIRMAAAYGTVDGEDKANNEDLGILTPDRFSLDTRVKIPEWNALTGIRIQSAGTFERREFDTATNSLVIAESRNRYTVFDLYASWRPERLRGIGLDVGIDNVFDTEYDRVFEGVSEPGRSFKAALTLQRNF